MCQCRGLSGNNKFSKAMAFRTIRGFVLNRLKGRLKTPTEQVTKRNEVWPMAFEEPVHLSQASR